MNDACSVQLNLELEDLKEDAGEKVLSKSDNNSILV